MAAERTPRTPRVLEPLTDAELAGRTPVDLQRAAAHMGWRYITLLAEAKAGRIRA